MGPSFGSGSETKPKRDRVPAHGKPSAGDHGRSGPPLRRRAWSKPLEARWFGASESDCEGRTGRGKARRGRRRRRRRGPRRPGEALKGRNPMSVARGNPGTSRWRSKPSRSSKRRGRNEAAEARLRPVDLRVGSRPSGRGRSGRRCSDALEGNETSREEPETTCSLHHCTADEGGAPGHCGNAGHHVRGL